MQWQAECCVGGAYLVVAYSVVAYLVVLELRLVVALLVGAGLRGEVAKIQSFEQVPLPW